MFAVFFSVIFVLLIIPSYLLGQIIPNVADLDTDLPNFYRWMEQNAYICETPAELDSPVFVTESEADQFHCAALCGDPIDNPHLACAKRPSQRASEWPQCHGVPRLCVLNFVQEFMALRMNRGQFRHLTQHNSLEDSRRAHQFGQRFAITKTTTIATTTTAITEAPLPTPGPLFSGSFNSNLFGGSPKKKVASFEQNLQATNGNSVELAEIDGETAPNAAHRRGGGGGRSSKKHHQKAEQNGANHKKHSFAHHQHSEERMNSVDRKHASLEFKDAPIVVVGLPAKLPFGQSQQQQKHNCAVPDVDSHACKFWAQHGECHTNPTYMLRECRHACGLCGGSQEEFRRRA